MDLNLKGKSVLVTGGNRGIGLEIALAFAGEGANVVVCGRDKVALAEEAVGDESPFLHKMALFDLAHKYGDLMSLEELGEQLDAKPDSNEKSKA